MTASSALLYAASDGRHRPASHPVLLNGQPAPESRLTEALFYHAIGQNIRIQREARGWTQHELGLRIRRSHVAVCKWETDQNRPDAWTIDRLERLFGARLRP